MNKLVFANLLHRPMRSVISVSAVAIEVVMILSIVAIFMGMLDDQKQRTNGIGADLVVSPSNASFVNGMSGAPMPAKLAGFLEKLPHVSVAAPVISNFSMSGNVEILYGIDYKSYDALKPFVFLAGGPFQEPFDVIVDDVFAHGGQGHKIGDSITILNHSFRICGIVESGKGGRKLIPIDTMGALIGAEGKASVIYLKSDSPDNDKLIISEVHATRGLSDYRIQTMADLISLYTPSRFPGFDIALRVVISIAVIVGFLVIFQSMYTAVMERTREIGVLKSLGASKLYVVNAVLRETALIAVGGILFGMVLTQLIRFWMAYRFPTLPFIIPHNWWLQGAGIAFVGAILGAVYPALKAASKDPIDALAYE
jgi:putative ABC transport system permease protein